MAEQALDRDDVGAAFQQACRVGVPELVQGRAFDARFRRYPFQAAEKVILEFPLGVREDPFRFLWLNAEDGLEIRRDWDVAGLVVLGREPRLRADSDVLLSLA